LFEECNTVIKIEYWEGVNFDWWIVAILNDYIFRLSNDLYHLDKAINERFGFNRLAEKYYPFKPLNGLLLTELYLFQQ
jgi:hypothetical protein